MTKAELQERISKKQEQITKIEKAIQKYIKYISPSPELLKACEERNRDRYIEHKKEFTSTPGVYYSSEDLWYKYGDLEEAKEIIKKYQLQIDKIDNFEKEEKIQVLVNFLAEWRAKAYEWHIETIKKYLHLKINYNKEWGKYKEENNIEDRDYYTIREFDSNYYKNIPTFIKDICWGISKFERVNLDKLDKMLDKEVKRKYADLVHRITAVVGVIEDVKGLSIGVQNGEINGVVIGSKGKVDIETISAGGPIQCWHYRVILHKLK